MSNIGLEARKAGSASDEVLQHGLSSARLMLKQFSALAVELGLRSQHHGALVADSVGGQGSKLTGRMVYQI